jgi:hypothetical protein
MAGVAQSSVEKLDIVVALGDDNDGDGDVTHGQWPAMTLEQVESESLAIRLRGTGTCFTE